MSWLEGALGHVDTRSKHYGKLPLLLTSFVGLSSAFDVELQTILKQGRILFFGLKRKPHADHSNVFNELVKSRSQFCYHLKILLSQSKAAVPDVWCELSRILKILSLHNDTFSDTELCTIEIRICHLWLKFITAPWLLPR